MLRNDLSDIPRQKSNHVLNEVLSLNAQESTRRASWRSYWRVLNEVLSLNAQEFDGIGSDGNTAIILNEVLSLNAQE